MNNEFKKIKTGKDTRYVLESASSGGTSSGSIASVSGALGGTRKRGDNLLAQEANKKEAPKPRNFVAKNAKMGGAGQHKDKKKAEKQGTVKHKKPYAESIDALKNKLDTLKEAFGRRDAYQRDYDSSVSGMGKRDSLAYRMDGGANDEGEDDFQNNYGVWINGRMWKVFATQHSANAVARSLQAKGKDAKVGLTSAPVSEQGVAEQGYGNHPSQRVDPRTGKKYVPPKSPLGQGVAEGFDGEYDDEAGMAHNNLYTIARAAQGLLDTIGDKENLPEWAQEKIAKVEGMLVSVWDYLQSQEEQGVDPTVMQNDAYMESLAESLATVLQEKAPPGDKYERMVKHIKKGYSKDGKLTDVEKSKAYGAAWKAKNKAKK